MSPTEVLAAGRLIRPVRRTGFCPACRGWSEGAVDRRRLEFDPAALITLGVLVVAATAWVWSIRRSSSMGAMGMGLGSVQSFATTWVVMMTAMMLPSALPLVFQFARKSEGRRGWQAATGALGLSYLSIWLLFGLISYAVYRAVQMPWSDQRLIGGLALVAAAAYGLTPLKRSSEARCRELCALHQALPFNVVRSGVVAGARYGISCVGCSAARMIATVLIGVSSLGWMVIIGGVVLVYKLAPPLASRYQLLVSVVIAALGIVFVVS